MRTLEQIEQELQEAREALSQVKGTPTEVYSRIVGYYRSVRNWNKGKREEYAERKLFRVVPEEFPRNLNEERHEWNTQGTPGVAATRDRSRLLLFIRTACPACPPAKDAATKLGIPVDFVDADTAEGLSEAVRRNVFSTPTAILLNREGNELARAWDAKSILAFAANQSQLESAV